MARYLFPDLGDGLAAVVSTHGYFEIQKAETYNSYASHVGPVFKSGTNERCPDPVVLVKGPVEVLGLTYDEGNDDLIEADDDYEVIKAALLRYLEEKS